MGDKTPPLGRRATVAPERAGIHFPRAVGASGGWSAGRVGGAARSPPATNSPRAPGGRTGGWRRWPRVSVVGERGEQRGSARRSAPARSRAKESRPAASGGEPGTRVVTPEGQEGIPRSESEHLGRRRAEILRLLRSLRMIGVVWLGGIPRRLTHLRMTREAEGCPTTGRRREERATGCAGAREGARGQRRGGLGGREGRAPRNGQPRGVEGVGVGAVGARTPRIESQLQPCTVPQFMHL